VDENTKIAEALKMITENNFSQLPVTKDNRIVGSVTENLLFAQLLKNPDVKSKPVSSIMQEALPFIDISTPIDTISNLLTNDNPAVIVKDFKADTNYIITRHDVVEALA